MTRYPPTGGYQPGSAVWPQWVQQAQITSAQISGAINVGDAYAYGNIWPQWVNQTYTPALTVQTTASSVWYDWQSQPITTGGTSQAIVWDAWQLQRAFDNRYLGSSSPLVDAAVRREPTAAELAERERQAYVRRTRARSFDLRRRLAARRAEQLLMENLNAAQQEEWKKGRYFTVHTPDGLRSYRIDYGLAGNVRLVKCDLPDGFDTQPMTSKRGRPLFVGARFCMHVYHPDGPVPNEDNVLAQKLLLEADEDQFLALANVS